MRMMIGATNMSRTGQLFYKFHRGCFYIKRKYSSFLFGSAVCKCGHGTDIMPEFWLEGGKYIFIGSNFTARNGLRLEAWDQYKNYRYTPMICIGDNVNVGDHCHIGAVSKVVIGNHVLMGSKVYITDHHHGTTERDDLEKYPADRELYSKGNVVIEDHVFIGDNVVIMPGVTVGHNSVLAANTVVTKCVPPFSVICGIPGKRIGACHGRESLGDH